MTSHNGQLIKNFHVARNLASCESFPCSDSVVYCVMLERLSWGFLADLPQCGRGCSVFCDHRWYSLWFRRGFVSRTHYWLVFSFLLPVIEHHSLPLCLGFAFQFCRPTACLMTCLNGDGAAPSCVSVVSFHFCWAMVSSHLMPRYGRFMQAPYSYSSAPISMLGVCRVLRLANVLLDEYYCWGRRDCRGVSPGVCPSCSLGVATLLRPDSVSYAISSAGS